MNNVSAVFTYPGVETEIGQVVIAVDPYPVKILLSGKVRNNFALLKTTNV